MEPSESTQLCEAPGPAGKPCHEPAEYEYVDGAHHGFLCRNHQLWRAENASRFGKHLHFIRLTQAAAPPLGRNERIQMHATNLALKEEIEELKRRNLEFYEANKKLNAECQGLHLRTRELESQIRDAKSANEQYRNDVSSLRSRLAAAVDEIARLEAIIPARPTPDEVHRQVEVLGLTPNGSKHE